MSSPSIALPVRSSPESKHRVAGPHRDGKLTRVEARGWSGPRTLENVDDTDHEEPLTQEFMLAEEEGGETLAQDGFLGDPTRAAALTALSDPIRLELARRLAAGPCSVRKLAEGFAVSRAAISQHLKVLLNLGLVSYRRHGPLNIYSLEPEPILRLQGLLNELSRAASLSARRWRRQAMLLERI